jgi:DNA polymerase III delta prime subunit
MINIHNSITEKLEYFRTIHKIPNIIFHGPSGCGKRTIVHNFVKSIYDNNKDKIKSFVMYVNCAHGKGIKFIREELKFFAKTHINSNGGFTFKSIILLNADKLTMDAQSALRRCIELFSHNTRFFIIVEDKYKLLKPILSRFCEIYVHEPVYNGTTLNLYKYNLNETYHTKSIHNLRIECLKKELLKTEEGIITGINIIELSTKLYEKGYNGLDIINLVENPKFLSIHPCKRYELLIAYNKVRKEFRNEKVLMIFILNFLFLEKNYNLENISFM